MMSPIKKLSIICGTMMLVALVAGLFANSRENVIFAQGFLAGIGLLWWICLVVFDAFHFENEPKHSQPIGSGLFGGSPPNRHVIHEQTR